MRRGGELGSSRIELHRARCQLLGKCGRFVCFTLYCADQVTELSEHAIVAAFQVTQFVIVLSVGSSHQISALGLAHQITSAPNSSNKFRGNSNDLKRDEEE